MRSFFFLLFFWGVGIFDVASEEDQKLEIGGIEPPASTMLKSHSTTEPYPHSHCCWFPYLDPFNIDDFLSSFMRRWNLLTGLIPNCLKFEGGTAGPPWVLLVPIPSLLYSSFDSLTIWLMSVQKQQQQQQKKKKKQARTVGNPPFAYLPLEKVVGRSLGGAAEIVNRHWLWLCKLGVMMSWYFVKGASAKRTWAGWIWTNIRSYRC